MGTLRIIGKELASVKENVPFNLATVISPLLFLLAFAVMVSGGITIPVETRPAASESAFLQATAEYRAPDGTPYLELETAPTEGAPDGRSADHYIVEDELAVSEEAAAGAVVHLVNDVNSNMTKNYANRLTGALVDYVDAGRDAGTVEVVEQTRYEEDIPWDESFAVSTLVFGAMLAGLLFGQLSMTSEWENATAKLLVLSPRPATSVAASKVVAAFRKALVAGAVLVGGVAVRYGRALAKTRVFKHIYVLLLVVVSFVLFDANSVGEAAATIGGLFGAAGVSAVNPISLYYLRSFAVVFLIGIVGATPLPKRAVEQLGSTRAGAMVVDVLEPLVLVSVLAVSTGYLVDGSFNPFLYFRF